MWATEVASKGKYPVGSHSDIVAQKLAIFCKYCTTVMYCAKKAKQQSVSLV